MTESQKIFELGFDRNQRHIAPVELNPEQNIPEWLNGSFIRNGPGLFYIGNKRFNHWFDGLAMLHKFDFDNGRVIYQSKFLDCNASREALSSKELTYSEFATDPCWSLFGRLRSMYKQGPTDSAKVNLTKLGDQYFALGETTMQIEFDLESLDTIGRYNFNQPKFGTSSTAHPHIDEDVAYNLITKYGPINKYQITKMDAAATKVADPITMSPSYMHSFGMTDKFFIIAESPFTVQSIKLMAVNRPFIENFEWDKNRGTRIWIIDRKTGATRLKKEISPFFFFHFVNSFDTDKGLVFDLVTYPDAAIIEAYYLDHISNPNRQIPGGQLTRFELDLANDSISSKEISSAKIELPHMDYSRYNMVQDYNYVYATSLSDNSSNFYDQLVKIDIKDSSFIHWKQDGCYPGEPIFVPSPESIKEDEGLIISLVIDALNELSFLLILNAQDFTEISRVKTPDPILAGFHGSFFKKEKT